MKVEPEQPAAPDEVIPPLEKKAKFLIAEISALSDDRIQVVGANITTLAIDLFPEIAAKLSDRTDPRLQTAAESLNRDYLLALNDFTKLATVIVIASGITNDDVDHYISRKFHEIDKIIESPKFKGTKVGNVLKLWDAAAEEPNFPEPRTYGLFYYQLTNQ